MEVSHLSTTKLDSRVANILIFQRVKIMLPSSWKRLERVPPAPAGRSMASELTGLVAQDSWIVKLL